MGLVYHFVSLDEEQNLRRRRLLDGYGQFAQLSVLLLPLLFQLFWGIHLLTGRLLSFRRVPKEHQSPVVSKFGKEGLSRGTKPVWSRLQWMLDDEVVKGWGTRREWIVAGVWAMWLLALVVKDTGDDYLHLTKSFGIVAASQLPMHYLLAAKSRSPIQYLTRMSHEELNPYHRLLGRIIITFLSIHATMYLNFYVQSNLLLKRIRDWDVILGLTAISILLLIGTTALAKVRNWSYRLFFYLHVILSVTLLPILYFHVSHLRAYILESAFIYIILILQRNYDQAAAQATITLLPSTNLLSISIPIIKNRSLIYRTYTPGQHIYLGFPSLPQKLRINPFTIANTKPVKEQKIQIIARALSGTTAILTDLATKPQPIPLIVEGPYGAATWFPNLAAYDQVLFVAGGVGATFTVPLYRDLLLTAARGEQTPALRFVWSVQKYADAQWGIDQLQAQCEGLPKGFQLHITRTDDESTQLFETSRDIRLGQSKLEPDESGDFELQENSHLLGGASGESAASIRDGVAVGRLDLHEIVDQVFQHDSKDRVAVLVCGPSGMGSAVRKEVGRWVGKGRDVFWHSEEFGW